MDDLREKAHRKTLDWIQHSIEQHITNWDLIEIEDIFYEETDSIVRCFTFSRGQREYLVIIDPRFYIQVNSVYILLYAAADWRKQSFICCYNGCLYQLF